MNNLRRIAAINDLSGKSQYSLTSNPHIISALGIQCVVMPANQGL